MHVHPTTAVLPNQPGPPQDRPAATAASSPTRSGYLLTVLRKLFDYGKGAILVLQQKPPFGQSHAVQVATWFGTPSIKLIGARVTRGLQMILALKQRLLRDAARLDRAPASGSRLPPPPRLPRPEAPRTEAPRTEAPRTEAPRTEAPRRRGLAAEEAALLLDPPTDEAIAARVRRMPIGRVIAEICIDLGIQASHPLWNELCEVIEAFGGSVARVLHIAVQRLRRAPREFARAAHAQLAASSSPGSAPGSTMAAAPATGPP